MLVSYDLIFSEEEFAELEAIAKGNYTDDSGNVYTTPEGFNADEWRKKYREGQEASGEQKSSYTLGKTPAIDSLNRKREEIQARTDFTTEQKETLLAAIDSQIKALQ